MLIFSIACSLISISGHTANLSNASKAIVKLYVTQQTWNMSQPWTKNSSNKQVCTGFFVAEGILTNAHCVADATYIEMEVPHLDDKIEAKIISVNHQVDLALLAPADPDFKTDVTPITFGKLPASREKVVTIGYPLGGRQISYTEGVVSRVDFMMYIHSSISNLLVQTDAAINPGNSGGPVFSDRTGECVGVATQKSQSGEAVGYFIPKPVVSQFLRDIADGKTDGIPALGSTTLQSLENPTLRKYLGLSPKQSGIRVLDIAKDSSIDGILEKDDVLLSIEGYQILNDGRISINSIGKISFQYPVTTKQVGDEIKLGILRKGVAKNIKIKLRPYNLTVIPWMPQYDKKPLYYIAGGLVFRTVETRYLQEWGRDWLNKMPAIFQTYLNTAYGKDGLEELVVISDILDAPVNKGYENWYKNIRVTKVNGSTINRLDDLINAFENAQGRQYHVVELDNNVEIVLDIAQANAEKESINKRYNIQ